MNKEIQPKTHEVQFKCASCGATFVIDSTYRNDVCSIDICSKCHPYYLGKNNQQTIKAKSDRLTSKFEAGKKFNETAEKKAEPKKTRNISNKRSKTINSLKDIKAAE